MATHRGGAKGGLKPEDQCPGSGTTMVARTYTVRKIESEDRARYARFALNARERGDVDEAVSYEQSILEWEREQGQERERLACPVCGDSFLVPTSRGTSRPHRRSGHEYSSWVGGGAGAGARQTGHLRTRRERGSRWLGRDS
jgi:predicted RNA-binding Zn-ribbon protein involved in translation (DUF1610 family)